MEDLSKVKDPKTLKEFHKFKYKFFESQHLDFKYYIPLGKPRPYIYREIDYQLFKIYESGVLDELLEEPLTEEGVKHLESFDQMPKSQDNNKGTTVDKDKAKKT